MDHTDRPAIDQLIALHNQARAVAGVQTLQPDSTLDAVAQERASDMAVSGHLLSASPSGATAFSLLQKAGYRYQRAAENGARFDGDEAPEMILQTFLDSDSHRSSLLDSRFSRIGIGQAFDAEGAMLVVILFAGQ